MRSLYLSSPADCEHRAWISPRARAKSQVLCCPVLTSLLPLASPGVREHRGIVIGEILCESESRTEALQSAEPGLYHVCDQVTPVCDTKH